MITNGPQAIIPGEMHDLDADVFFFSRQLVAVHLKRIADDQYQVSLSGHIEGPIGCAWYTMKRSDPASAEQAARAYNIATSWAERVSAGAVERLTLAAIEELSK